MAEEMISMEKHHEAMKKNTDFYLGVIGSQTKSLRELQASYDTLLKEKQEQEEYTYELHIKELHYYDLQKMYKVLEQKCDEYEAQIEKMKCCENCKHKNLNWVFSPICEARDEIKIENPLTCKCDKWEIKENERSNIK